MFDERKKLCSRFWCFKRASKLDRVNLDKTFANLSVKLSLLIERGYDLSGFLKNISQCTRNTSSTSKNYFRNLSTRNIFKASASCLSQYEKIKTQIS